MTAKEKVLAVYPQARRETRVLGYGGAGNVIEHVIRDATHGGAELATGLTPNEAWKNAASRLVTKNP